ncbi:hypothetical protein N0V88_001813 [Collariella sp. IMI 366227]|nr:hypothetical protein N0V88_001813 [Collariella sp. IMI 366227]
MPRKEEKSEEAGGRKRQPRQFMIVSRPCDHPDCPPRSGFIRGTYESVELIREVPVEKPLRRVRSSIDLSRAELKSAMSGRGERLDKEAVLRAAKKAVGEEAESEGETSKSVSFRVGDSSDDDTEMAIEWLMVTRSDPGGSVPRFMVEKGTPGGIIGDAGKFLKWLASQSMEDVTKPRAEGAEKTNVGAAEHDEQSREVPTATSAENQLPDDESDDQQEMPPASNSGIYGLLTSALELSKLQQRMRKAQEKLERAQAKRRAKHNGNNNGGTDGTTDTPDPEKEKEDDALAKLREKHAREVARQEEKYQRELQRLADKRAAEERKAEERRKKAIEREEKGNLAMELERVKAERDVARKEVEILQAQVGELQGQNTRLVVRLGKKGVNVEEVLKGQGRVNKG